MFAELFVSAQFPDQQSEAPSLSSTFLAPAASPLLFINQRGLSGMLKTIYRIHKRGYCHHTQHKPPVVTAAHTF
jgi:hypothetical protein